MNKYIFNFFLLLFLLIEIRATSTEGTPYLINFFYEKHTHNQIWSIEQSPRKTILIAKRTGLLEFDSESWTDISTPDIPLKIFTSESPQQVFISGRGYIGKLDLNDKGLYNFTPFKHPDINNQLFNEIFETDSDIFFYSSNLILQKKKDYVDSIYSWLPEQGTKFSGYFKFGNKCYVYIKNKGIRALSDSLYLNQENFGLTGDEEIVCSAGVDSSSVLLGSNTGKLFKFDGRQLVDFEIEDSTLITSGIITDGISLSNNLIAISTRNFGVLIFNKFSGKTVTIIDQEAGLPSDHIMTMLADRESGLWFAHSKGLTRIDANLPVTNFSSYSGLDAGVNAVRFWNNRLFLATTSGVYSLDTISHYDTKEVTQKIPINRSRYVKSITIGDNDLAEELKPTNEQQKNTTEEEQKKRKGFLKNLFGKKDKEKIEPIEKTTPDPTPKKSTTVLKPKKIEYQSFKYETFVLKSKTFGYAPIPEISERCKYLLPFENHLLAISDSKLYAISKDKEVIEIFSSSQIYKVSIEKTDQKQINLITSDGIYTGSFTEGEWLFSAKTLTNINFKITAISQLTESGYLLALNNQLVFYSAEDEKIKTIYIENPYSEKIYLQSVGEKHYVIVGRTLYYVHGLDFDDIKLQQETDFSVFQQFFNQPENLWIKTEDKQFRYFGENAISKKLLAFLQVFKNINDIHFDADSNIWVVDNYENIYKINNSAFEQYSESIEISIKTIEKPSGEFLALNNLNLSYSENALRFSIIAPTYLQNNSNQFQYIIEGLPADWSKWSSDNIINVPYLPAGNFTLKVRAKDILGNISEISSIDFKVSPPFWETPYFYAIIILLMVLIIYLIQQYRMKKLVKEKKVLSKKVKERTIELELKNKAITDSINYAGKMQSALLPSEETIQTCLKDSFIFFKPRNIVSGDFYWSTQKKQYTIVAAADCTGHGVPGAFMSMLSMTLMSEIVNKTKIIDAAQILNTLREKIIQLLAAKHAESKDGMDIALLVFNKENNSLQYAGAHNPLYRLVSRKNKLTETEKSFVSKENDKYYLMHYKANRFHVGKSNYSETKFTNHNIKYNPDDIFYIFSDGFPDQFGGKDERKFMYGPFKKLILDIADKSMKEQETLLNEAISKWMHGYEQTDDMLIFGIRP